jgi:protein involved in polysaccharide export with SLBB domain
MAVDPSGLAASEVGRAGSISIPTWARNPIGFALFAVTYSSSLGDGTLGGVYNSNNDLTNSIGKISDTTGLSPQEIRDRIHNAKQNLPKSTNKRNPDVQIDVKTGEIYPEIHGGGVGDSIGNIFDE